MLAKYAWQFYLLNGFLLHLHGRLGIPPRTNPLSSSGAGIVQGIPTGGFASALIPMTTPIIEKNEGDDIVNTLRGRLETPAGGS